MMKIFYVIKWILGSLLFLLLLDLVVKPAVMAPNQKGYQDGTKLPEQRLLPETSPALNVEEENHALELNQISRKRLYEAGVDLKKHYRVSRRNGVKDNCRGVLKERLIAFGFRPTLKAIHIAIPTERCTRA
ncbi:unnamed protein product [Clavelina lepadiformis]|uniref:Uncharacterized protein n=1 Tax=Clavelina lepadiformis TaxID=159417 RepID=A0ABP0FRB0_CLALP